MINLKKFGAITMAVLVLGVFGFSSSAAGQSASPCAADVVVQSGDTLAAIAARTLADPSAFPRIVAATNAQAAVDDTYTTIDNPNVLQVGWKLCVPGAASGFASPDPAVGSPVTLDNQTESIEDLISAVTLDIAREFDTGQIRQLAIESVRARVESATSLAVEKELTPTAEFRRYLVSYRSEGLKIFALMAVPAGDRPDGGWPVIILNHGYVPPGQDLPTDRYDPYVYAFARSGYIVVSPDYRGQGDSEGQPDGTIIPDYTVDILNAVAAIKRYPDVDADRIGMWGHSLGGNVTLRAMVEDESIRAGVIWSGVVVSVADLLMLLDFSPVPIPARVLDIRQRLYDEYGTPQENSVFWDTLSPNNFLDDLSGPVQLHHGSADKVVPILFSAILTQELQDAGQSAEFFPYIGDDHTLSNNFDIAIARSVDFFDRYVKRGIAVAP